MQLCAAPHKLDHFAALSRFNRRHVPCYSACMRQICKLAAVLRVGCVEPVMPAQEARQQIEASGECIEQLAKERREAG